jgi:N-methylhydantoinase B
MRLPSRFGDQRLNNGDLLRIERPGGGGLGNPLDRAAEQVLEDVRQGYVSVARAKSDYKVSIHYSDSEPCLDRGETQVLRGKL